MLDGLAGKMMIGMLTEEQKMALAKALEPASVAVDPDSPVPVDVSITTCLSLVHGTYIAVEMFYHIAFKGIFEVSDA